MMTYLFFHMFDYLSYLPNSQSFLARSLHIEAVQKHSVVDARGVGLRQSFVNCIAFTFFVSLLLPEHLITCLCCDGR